jgi:hypothetical protein
MISIIRLERYVGLDGTFNRRTNFYSSSLTYVYEAQLLVPTFINVSLGKTMSTR